MSPLTTHVLDTASGRPALGLHVRLERLDLATGGAELLARGLTDGEGRVRDLLRPGQLTVGDYRLTFETGAYFLANNVEGFYPYVSVVFTVRNPGEHHHVPLLLSPWGYSTYRGS